MVDLKSNQLKEIIETTEKGQNLNPDSCFLKFPLENPDDLAPLKRILSF